MKLRKQYKKNSASITAAERAWRDSWDNANRYYGFGCRDLCADRFESASTCFSRSLGSNGWFVKAWIGLAITRVPFAAKRLKFAYRSSMRLQTKAAMIRSTQQKFETLGSAPDGSFPAQ